MSDAIWTFDVISPFSYLALGEIEELSRDMNVTYRPVFLGALLRHWKHLGPAEIPPKRLQTYRFCVFEAGQRGISMRFPPVHPFNPLKPLRLLTALDADPRAVRIVMDCIWRDGLDLETDEGWSEMCQRLGLETSAARALTEDEVSKARLRAASDEAIASGLFGVPTLQIGNENFWGLDAMPMARAYLADPHLFEKGELARVATLRNALSSR